MEPFNDELSAEKRIAFLEAEVLALYRQQAVYETELVDYKALKILLAKVEKDYEALAKMGRAFGFGVPTFSTLVKKANKYGLRRPHRS